MKTRKIILLGSILVLALVLVLQLVFSGGSKVRYINLKDDAELVVVEKNGSEAIQVAKKTDDVYIINGSIEADVSFAQAMFSQIKTLKIIDTVANSVTDEAELERYGLNPLSLITVTAQKGGKTVRTVKLGKAASSGSQTYAKIDGSDDVVLVSGYLRSHYEKSVEDLTKKAEAAEETETTQSPEDGLLDVNSSVQ